MVYLIMADGFEEIEALTVVDVLRRGGVEIKTVGLNGKTQTGAHKISVGMDISIDGVDKENMEMVILPGGGGYVNLENSDKVQAILDYANEKELYLAAICAAPSILGNKGFLKGHKATCYPGFEKNLKGAEKVSDRAVVSGRFITANGPGSSIAFAYEILKILKGKDIADKTVSAMQYE